MNLIKTKARRRMLAWFLATAWGIQLAERHWIAGPLLVFAIFAPSWWFAEAVWTICKFNFMPGPIQLMRGFNNLWPAMSKGPVQTRVTMKRSSTLTP